MKLMKFNALLFLFSIGLCVLSTNALENSLESGKLKKRIKNIKVHLKNEKYMNFLEERMHDNKDQNKKATASSKTSDGTSKKASNTPSTPSKPSASKSSSIQAGSTPTVPKLVEIENKKINKDDTSFSHHKQCKSKQGYLKIVKNPEKLPKELNLFKIVATLNPKNLDLYISHDLTSLFNQISLDNISKISQEENLKSFNCFDIETNTLDDEKLLRGPLTLCAKNKEDMDKWIDAISEFKQCKIDKTNSPLQESDSDSKILIDFSVVNKTPKIKSPAKVQKSKSGTQSLYYENTKKPAISSNKQILKEKLIKSAMERIMSTIKESNLKEAHFQRLYLNKIKAAKLLTKEVKQKQAVVKNILKQRADKEQEKETEMIKNLGDSKEIELLKAAEYKIKTMKEEELKKIQNELNEDLENEKKKTDLEVKKMIKNINEETKDTPFDECVDTKLLFFKNLNYSGEVCKKNYGESVSNIMYLNLIFQNFNYF